MLNKFAAALTDDNELNSKTLRLLSLAFLLIAGAMSFHEYSRNGFLGWEHKTNIRPDFVATILAILIMAPLYLRGILKWKKSVFGIASFSLMLLVIASFVKLALGAGGPIGHPVLILLATSITLSWLGIKEIAGVGWILSFAAAIFSVLTNSITMGFYGFIYVGAGFLGLVLHSGLSPGQLVQGVKREFSSTET